MKQNEPQCDALIIGSGVAGLTCALYMARAGRSVTILSKSDNPAESNSRYAQGGIIYAGKNDSPDKLAKDITEAGAGFCYPPAVDLLAAQGPATVEELLINIAKVPFSKENGELHLTAEGGHSMRRILHREDQTGAQIVEKLLDKVKNHPNITLETGKMAVDLITREHHAKDLLACYKPPECFGAYVLDTATRKVSIYRSAATVLASGGLGQIYRHTTNPDIATGDGFAMALRAGAPVINMEYTQFHPTTLYHPDADSFLISEAVRGEGAVLTTQDGKQFMDKYHERGCLAPRDVVTRGILEELVQRDETYVYLDLSPIPRADIIRRFPGIRAACEKFSIDITRQPIPVVPAFHFSCGGVKVDTDAGTGIHRLYAVGETSCTGVHGANRLASTSLLECVVWGKRCAEHISANWPALSCGDNPQIPEWNDKGLEEEYDPALVTQDWITLKNIMWNYVGPIRTSRRLQRAFTDMHNLETDLEKFYRNTRLTRSIVELRNAVTVGLSITGAAWRNRTSRGCHYRKD